MGRSSIRTAAEKTEAVSVLIDRQIVAVAGQEEEGVCWGEGGRGGDHATTFPQWAATWRGSERRA